MLALMKKSKKCDIVINIYIDIVITILYNNIVERQ